MDKPSHTIKATLKYMRFLLLQIRNQIWVQFSSVLAEMALHANVANNEPVIGPTE